MNKLLAEKYETEKGAAPALAHLVGNLVGISAGVALQSSDKKRQEKLILDAELMDQLIRQIEAERMGHMIANLKHASMDTAISAGSALARSLTAGELEKSAFIGGLARTAVNVGRRALGKAPTRLAAGSKSVSRAVPRPAHLKGKLTPASSGPAEAGRAKVQKEIADRGVPAPPRPKPSPAQVAAASTAPVSASPSKPMNLKRKLVGAGLAAGAVGAGYKGLQATRDYMMVPTGQSRYGATSPPIRHNVGAYGYPQY